ncbi:unnamed protein product [Ixodes hexagonus]
MFTVEQSLFQTVLNFVADHLTSVESLVNVPEVVGEQIFRCALGKRAFADHAQAERRLEPFVAAYGDALLRSLCLRESLLLINEYTEPLVTLSRHLVHLDLGCCGLGDGHELVAAVAQMVRLEMLSLRENGLTDGGVRRLTLPCRMLGRGPLLLNELDLAGNAGIGDKSAASLACFNRLRLVNLSGTSLGGANRLGSCLGLRACRQDPGLCHPTATIGWAAPLLDQWHGCIEDAASKRRHKRLLLSPPKTGICESDP